MAAVWKGNSSATGYAQRIVLLNKGAAAASGDGFGILAAGWQEDFEKILNLSVFDQYDLTEGCGFHRQGSLTSETKRTATCLPMRIMPVAEFNTTRSMATSIAETNKGSLLEEIDKVLAEVRNNW